MINDHRIISSLFSGLESGARWDSRDWESEDMVSLLPAVREFSPDALATKLLKNPVIYDTALPMISKKRHARLMNIKRLVDEIAKRDHSIKSFKNLSMNYSNTRSRLVSEIADSVYIGTYRAIFDMPLRKKNAGLWMIVLVDSWISVDTNFSFSENALNFVDQHPKINFAKAISTDVSTYAEFGSDLLEIKSELEAKIELLKQSANQGLNTPPVVRNAILTTVAVLALVVSTASLAHQIWIEKMKRDKEAAEAAAAAAAEAAEKQRIEEERKRQEEADATRFAHEMAGMGDIEHASDHVDLFDRNRDRISTMA